jgi:integrase
MAGSTRGQPPTLFDPVRQLLRLHRDSRHAERASPDGIVRGVRFHRMRSRNDRCPPEPNIEGFRTDVAVDRTVAAATQHQAMQALVCLDTRALHHALPGRIHAVRADRKINVPVVTTREEVASVIALMDGTAYRVTTRLYGNGVRITEAVRLRIQDIGFPTKESPLTHAAAGRR